MKTLWTILLTLTAVYCSGCPEKSYPPRMNLICTGDGHGGGDCRTPEQVDVYKSPSELKNWWMVSQEDAAALTAWCYGVSDEKGMQMVQNFMAERGVREN